MRRAIELSPLCRTLTSPRKPQSIHLQMKIVPKSNSVRVRPRLSDIGVAAVAPSMNGRSVYMREHVIAKDVTKTRPPKPASNLDKN
jgi:hypothetical protein